MRNLLVAFALLLVGSGVAWADGIPQVVDPRNNAQSPWTVTVFNDSGATVNSGEIVVWDRVDSDVVDHALSRPYVITSSTADDVYTAGVMVQTCPNQSACDIIVRGIALVRCADASDAVTVGTTVGQSSTVAGLCGDYTPAANKASLGLALESGAGTDYEYITVYVYPSLAEQ